MQFNDYVRIYKYNPIIIIIIISHLEKHQNNIIFPIITTG